MRVLAIGAHPDDIEIGCGGTLLWHRERNDDVHVLVMTDDHRDGDRSSTRRRREAEQSARALGASLSFGGSRDRELSALPAIETIEEVADTFSPSLVYVHDPDDTHQDHRTTSTAAASALRRERSLLYYKGPSSTNATANVYVDIGKFLHAKIELVTHHASQIQPSGWIDVDLLTAIARTTGHPAKLKYAEGFTAERLVLGDGHMDATNVCLDPAAPSAPDSGVSRGAGYRGSGGREPRPPVQPGRPTIPAGCPTSPAPRATRRTTRRPTPGPSSNDEHFTDRSSLIGAAGHHAPRRLGIDMTGEGC